LFQVSFWDPRPLVISVVLLVACALLAAMIPARLAASLDPVKALHIQ
jgi:ABC-type antimicrobial peptide transport system permease subunit